MDCSFNTGYEGIANMMGKGIKIFIDNFCNLKPEELTDLLDEVETKEVIKFANEYIKDIRKTKPHYDPIEELKFFSDYMKKHEIIYDIKDRLLKIKYSNSQ